MVYIYNMVIYNIYIYIYIYIYMVHIPYSVLTAWYMVFTACVVLFLSFVAKETFQEALTVINRDACKMKTSPFFVCK
jgi:Na+/H+ antiporter NhaD/arsenite permease-like protein